MGSTLRNFVLAPAVLAAAALATNTAMAATVKVPFNFTVAGKNLPAGYYSVWREVSQNMVTLRSYETPQSFTWVLAPGDPAPTDSAVVLRFSVLGEAHALRSVQYGPLITFRLDKKAKQTGQMIALNVPGQ
jgi:hypothetical protein